MIPVLYKGSVKDVRGPVKFPVLGQAGAVIFDYTDAYSVFDWGRMPDSLPHKGSSLAIIAADWFEKLADASTWKEFSKSQDALALRRGNRFGAAFNELGETLQREGLATHYLGALSSFEGQPGLTTGPELTAKMDQPFQRIAVRQVSVVKPRITQVAGRAIPDYTETRKAPSPRLIPLEVVFRFSLPAGSSLPSRVKEDPRYLSDRGYGDLKIQPGAKWDFPLLELFTKLESTDRPLTFSEALAISGISGEALEAILFRTAWVAGWLRSVCTKGGLELADGKLEWAILQDGSVMLVDAIGPDELRLLKNGVQLSKEFLRAFYRKTPWYSSVVRAKDEATNRGSAEWKKWVAEGPEPLPPAMKELASQLYQALANELTGRRWFKNAWDLERVAREIGEVPGEIR